MVDDTPYQHEAFISYSTAGSGLLAAALELSLEGIGKSWDQATARDVYLDASDQTAAEDLTAELKRHLNGSTFLVLLTSPAAAISPWVNKELEYWLETKGTMNLLLAVAAGSVEWNGSDFDPSSDLPTALFGAFEVEPRWSDLRSFTNQHVVNFQAPEFVAAVADLVARIAGIPKAELVNLHWKRHRESVALRLASEALATESVSRTMALHMARAAVLGHDVPATRRSLAEILIRTDGWLAVEHDTTLTALVAGPGPSSITVGAADGTIRVLDLDTGRQHSHRPGSAQRITALAYSANGAHLAVGYADGRYLTGTGTNRAHGSVNGAVGHVAVGNDGDVAAAAATSGDTVVISTTMTSPITSDEYIGVRCLRFRNSSEILVHDWSAITAVNVTTGSRSIMAETPSLLRPGPVAFDRTGTNWAQSQLDGGAIGVLPLSDGPSRWLEGPRGFIDAVAFDPAGARVVEVIGREVLVWIVDDERIEYRQSLSLDAVDEVAVGPDASWIAVLGEGRAEVIRREAEPCLRARVGWHEHDVPSVIQAAVDVAFSPGGRGLSRSLCKLIYG